ncbi:MAG: error-prone DNA polymerase [Gemmatimonas sp.]
MDYVELQVTTNFSFLRGASHPEELVAAASHLGQRAIAITDRNTLAGVVRAYGMAKSLDMRIIVGTRIELTDGRSVLALPTDRAAYGRLSQLLTVGKRRAPKGECHLALADLLDHGEGQILVALPSLAPSEADVHLLHTLKARFGDAVYLAAQHRHRGDDRRRIDHLARIASWSGVPLVATNDVLYHHPDRRMLQDVVTCIRDGVTIHEAGRRLEANAERHLKSADEMAALFVDHGDAIARTIDIAERCRFTLDEIRYEYPVEIVPEGTTPQRHLERLAWDAAAERYPSGIPDRVRDAVNYELALIEKLAYAPYFLTVHDIVRYARSQGILCQGRGSAANSVVCYVLGITSVDPEQIDVLFERFISAERNEPPDIDVDFEHERREEVIQYIYRKYGRDRAALAATVISYRSRSAIRDVGKAMGLSLDAIGALSRTVWGSSDDGLGDGHIRATGLDPEERTLATALALAKELRGFPRHLSQHVGGFVISRGPLASLVPIENAAMEDRTVIEWDKDDLDTLGLLKIDVLALGMLTCIRKSLALIERHWGRRYDLHSIPQEDKGVYEMLSRADSIGVFQVESRAQMSMLPRLKPATFYDLVVEVAIVRPGPIQGDMVHPYLRRRDGKEKVTYPSTELRAVLEKTMGVPLFQEQAMKIAIVAAGFTPAQADQLRRAMATFRHVGTITKFEREMIDGMVRNGYDRGFAERCFHQIRGFGEYGFPESHAASFALLVYVSAWIKHHYPAAFAAGLLNSQPMGFYAPAQIVRDAREHGVETRPVDVNASDWDCTLEQATGGRIALRLGLRQIRGFSQTVAERLVARRGSGYRTLRELWQRGRLAPSELRTLADGDAFGSLGLDRRRALWEIHALGETPLPLFAHAEKALSAGHNAPPPDQPREPEVVLPEMRVGEHVVADYRHLSLTLRRHPVGLLRDRLAPRGVVPCASLATAENGSRTGVTGLVLVRQRPGTSKGVIFATVEDESGIANIVIWARTFERFRRTVMESRLMAAYGTVQREGMVTHLVAEELQDLSGELRWLSDEAGATAPSRADAAAAIPEGRNFH